MVSISNSVDLFVLHSILGCFIVGAILLTLVYWRGKSSSRSKMQKKDPPADTVILHQLGRGPHAPSMSPFALKLETFLRMAKIPYQNVHSWDMSSKGKCPWISYNKTDLADSQFCIDYLTETLGKDMNAHLTDEQRAIALAFRKMVEEDLFWTVMMYRWLYEPPNRPFLTKIFPEGVIKQVPINVKNQAHAHGIGRHSQEEVDRIIKAEMAALSQFLGKKKFLMGDEPSETDCAIFGLLAQMKWHLPGSPHETMMKAEFTNLGDYCERMKDRFWPDWDECNTAGGTKEAPK